MNQTAQKKVVLIEAVIKAFNLPNKPETIIDLSKLNLQTLELLVRGIHSMQSEKITKY